MGRFSGLATALSTVADKLKKDREAQQELGQKQNLLGYEGLIKGNIASAQQGEQGAFSVPGMGKMKPIEQMKAVVNPTTGQIEYSIPKKSVFKPQEHPEITKTTALGILSDPVKSEQLKQTYPDVYSLVESVATNDGLSQPTEKRIKVVDKSGGQFTIPQGQLEDALKQGYRRIP